MQFNKREKKKETEWESNNNRGNGGKVEILISTFNLV